jgi:hypothetical protein
MNARNSIGPESGSFGSLRRCVWVSILIGAALIGGCVAITPRWRVASLDLRVGDTVTTVVEAAVYLCAVDDSTLGWLFAPNAERPCLVARDDVPRGRQIVTPVPIGTRFRVAKIRHQNRFEEAFYVLYFESLDANIGIVRVHDFDVPELIAEAPKLPARSTSPARPASRP